MAKVKFPYTMLCPKCKAGLKIKSPKLVGQRISCPACGKRIDVVTPEEDGNVPYGVEDAPEPEPLPEPTEEEILEAEMEEKREKRKALFQQFKYWGSVLWLVALIVVGGVIIYVFAIAPAAEDERQIEEERAELIVREATSVEA